ncbi:hypothetical protein ACH5A2_28730 [Streptomyces collinus]|uniref:hypothetical protein n=1 Tax=Streptomyces collinus TaxID=42684 RepID=UPI0037AAEF47
MTLVTFPDPTVQQEFFDTTTWGSTIAGAPEPLIAQILLFGNSRHRAGTFASPRRVRAPLHPLPPSLH